MSYQKAQHEDKRAALYTPFAREFLTKKFGQVVTDFIYENMPKYQRGAHKGQPKGCVQWLKVTTGGWSTSIPDSHVSRGVVKPGTQFVRVTIEWDRDAPRVFSQMDTYGDDTDQTKYDRILLSITNIINNPKRETRYG